MPRKPRKKSASSVYHIVVKGLDSQVLFEDDNDYFKYLELLELYKNECNFDLYAYCLMSNHIHLLIRISDVPLATVFQKLNTNYAVWFNLKYQRTGHLQQDRYYSEPVENIPYFLSALRYIHRNPINAGLEKKVGTQYKWSSIYEYIYNDSALIDLDEVWNIIGKNKIIQYFNEENTDICMDIDSIRRRIPDDVAREIVIEITGCHNSTEFQKLSLPMQKKYINILYLKNLSVRQINRILGVSKGIIERTIKYNN